MGVTQTKDKTWRRSRSKSIAAGTRAPLVAVLRMESMEARACRCGVHGHEEVWGWVKKRWEVEGAVAMGRETVNQKEETILSG